MSNEDILFQKIRETGHFYVSKKGILWTCRLPGSRRYEVILSDRWMMYEVDISSRYKGFIYKRTIIPLHRFIYWWFNGSIPPNFSIDHIDQNSSNNSIENLEAVTRGENIRRMWKHPKNSLLKESLKYIQLGRTHSIESRLKIANSVRTTLYNKKLES